MRFLRFGTLIFCSLLFCFHFSELSLSYTRQSPQRIVSLAPNMTELLFALGLGHNIVGVTNFCDYPPEAKEKPKIGGMSNPSLEAIVSLKPDLVVMTTDGNPKEIDGRLRSLGIETYIFRAKRISELPEAIKDLGAALGKSRRASDLARIIEVNLAGFNSAHYAERKKVLFVVWPEPLIVAGPGSIANDAISILGAENIASSAKSEYPKYSIEEILRQAPDVIFIGKGHKDMERVSRVLLGRLKSVPAVKNKKVFYVSDYLYRLTPRTMNGLQELVSCMGLNK